MNLKSKFLIFLAVIYILTAGSTFAALKYAYPATDGDLASPLTGTEDSTPQGSLISVDPGAPRTEACPLNGELYTKAERQVWEERRPLLVMVENHHEARPQLGLSRADVVYEAVAEGGITRFMAAFYCDAVRDNVAIAPVRSARTYFLDWASEYSKFPIYVHVGGANTPNKANALGQIEDYGWAGRNDLNQFGLSVKECRRDDSPLKEANNLTYVPTEHTMQCYTESLWKLAEKRGFAAEDPKGNAWTDTFIPWKFEDPSPSSQPSARTITFNFWDNFSQYTVKWEYDSTSNTYKRNNGGTLQQDYTTQKPLETRNLVLQYVKETGPIDAEKHMLYGTTGTGKATIFKDGLMIQGKWSKKDRLSRTVFTDSAGKEIKFSRGKIWIEALPSTTVPIVD